MKEYLIGGGIFVVVMAATYVVAYFKGSKKACNVENIVKEIDTLSPLLGPVVNYVEGKLPEPIKSNAQQVTGVIGQAVTLAEDMWKDGLLTDDSRKAYATSAIQWGLKLAGIKFDDGTNKLVSTAIDLAVGLFLPKSHTTAPAA